MAKVELREFDWAGLVHKGTFESMAFAIVGAGIGLIVLQGPASGVPDWLLVNVGLSCVCVFLGYLRVWKTAREEQETADLWAAIDRPADRNEEIVNRVFEFPYLFSISILPFTAAAPQAFMVTLFFFYATDNYYNSALARGVAILVRDPASPGRDDAGTADAPDGRALAWIARGFPGARRRLAYLGALITGIRRTFWVTRAERGNLAKDNEFVPYFQARFRYNNRFMLLLAAAFVIVSAQMVWKVTMPIDAGAVTLIALLLITVVELVVEPHRNLGMTFTPAGSRSNDVGGPDHA